MTKNFFKRFAIGSIILLLLCMGLVILFDPFFQYHKPLPGLKAVLSDKEYQCIGTLKNFDYDSLIVGSSVCENYNNRWFDEGFDCTSIKAIRSYGATADLCYLMDVAFEKQEIKYVFYNLDPSALSAIPETTYESTGCPMYLYDDNYFNDIQYLLNKDVLFEKIPYLIANSFIGDYDEGDSYNWAQWKTFSEDMILSHYVRQPSIAPMQPADAHQEYLDANIALLTKQITAHPETEFIIFVPPYSILWWDNIYRTGETESYLYNMEVALKELLTYENVELHFFLNDRTIVTDLNNYMDTLHFSKEVNHYIYNCLKDGSHKLTAENYEDIMHDMRSLAYDTVNELLIPYEDRIIVGSE